MPASWASTSASAGGSAPGSGSSAVACTRCCPAGAYDGAMLLITAVLITGPAPGRASSITNGRSLGGSAAANHQVIEPFIGGAFKGVRSAAVTGSVATTTADAVSAV